MSTHLTEETLGRLQRRELPPAEILPALRHLAACEECVARSQQELRVDRNAVLSSHVPAAEEAEEQHLDAVTQLIPYVDGARGNVDREIVESHLEHCAMCRAEVRDLRGFREVVGRRRRRRIALWAIAAVVAVVVASALFLLRQPSPVPSPRPPIATRPEAPRPVPEKSVQPADSNAEWDRLVAVAIETRRLPYPDVVASLQLPPATVLRGSAGRAPAAMQPMGITVADERPRFTWPAREGATYVVLVFAGDAEVARSAVLTEPRWRPAKPLEGGRVYTWQVESRRGDDVEVVPAPPEPPARFRVIDAKDRREIDEALRRFPDAHLVHATLYARAGLESHARAALERAVRAGDSKAKMISADPRKKQ